MYASSKPSLDAKISEYIKVISAFLEGLNRLVHHNEEASEVGSLDVVAFKCHCGERNNVSKFGRPDSTAVR